MPETTVETAITGMVQTISLKELVKLDAGIFSTGDRKLTVLKTAGLQAGDRVKITEADAAETEWNVKAKLDAPNAGIQGMELDFETFLLARKTA